MTAEVWKPGDPCPNCGPKGQVKFNGGTPLCIVCGIYMDAGCPRTIVGATLDNQGRFHVDPPCPCPKGGKR